MTQMQSNIFVFVVLPLIFIVVWSCAFIHNRRITRKIHEIEGPSGHLDSMEAGIAAAMNDRSHRAAR